MRVHYLTRTGMIPQAIDFILKENPNFEVTLEQYENAQNTKKYDKKRGYYTSKEIRRINKTIDEYLDKHYLMYTIDYTDERDYGSRMEAILVCKKPEHDESGDDFMIYSPDFTKDIVACFYR